jgi:hypothetical protein
MIKSLNISYLLRGSKPTLRRKRKRKIMTTKRVKLLVKPPSLRTTCRYSHSSDKKTSINHQSPAS